MHEPFAELALPLLIAAAGAFTVRSRQPVLIACITAERLANLIRPDKEPT